MLLLKILPTLVHQPPVQGGHNAVVTAIGYGLVPLIFNTFTTVGQPGRGLPQEMEQLMSGQILRQREEQLHPWHSRRRPEHVDDRVERT